MNGKTIDDLTTLNSLIPSGSDILVGGFMSVGGPVALMNYLATKGSMDNLHIIANDAGHHCEGIGALIYVGKVSCVTASHVGLNPDVNKMANEGKMDITLVPQGTLIERIRSAGYGLGGFLTPTGVGTEVEKGKQKISIEGKEYLLELPLKANIALLMAHKADKWGNLIIDKTCINFNEVMATAADLVIVQANEIVEVGELDPSHIRVPHIFVDYIIDRKMLKEYEGVIHE